MRELQARLTHAKSLRVNQTDAETKLWYQLRAHRLGGFKFKRQVRISTYIADFVCLDSKLVVELDGGQHLENPADLERDRVMNQQGYRVLRFWNDAVLQETNVFLK